MVPGICILNIAGANFSTHVHSLKVECVCVIIACQERVEIKVIENVSAADASKFKVELDGKSISTCVSSEND